MTASRTRRAVTSALVAGACAVLALAGCGAGQTTQTARQVAAVPGANLNVGVIALRDLTIAYPGPGGYPAGADAALVVRIFNNGVTPVTLVAATSDEAEAITVVGGPAVTVSPPETTPPASPSPSGSPNAAASTGSPSPGASPSPASSPSPTGVSPSPPPAPAPPPVSSRLSIQIPPQSYALLVPGQGSYLQLTRLKQPVVPGASVGVTFVFDNGISAPIRIPLAPPLTEVPRPAPVVPGGEEGHE